MHAAFQRQLTIEFNKFYKTTGTWKSKLANCLKYCLAVRNLTDR